MYSPTIPDEHTISLKRLAWATGRPMTKTAAALIENVLSFVDPATICAKCRDTSKCSQCFFSGMLTNGDAKMLEPLKFKIEILEDFHMRPKQVSVLISKKVGKNFCSWAVSHGVTAELESEDHYQESLAILDSALKNSVSASLPMGPGSHERLVEPQHQIPENTTTA